MENNNKPFLVQAGEGFSVQYKNKLLYSKYNPSRNIKSIINNLTLLPDTLILCFSPVLEYGIDELAQKLPENCLMLGCEKDTDLYEIAVEKTAETIAAKNGQFKLLKPQELFELPLKTTEYGLFKRTISIDFSAGTSFNTDFYRQLFEAVRNAVAQFWKNRVTLVKFGKRYSLNLFKNLYKLPLSTELPVSEKPVLVCGAGESLTYVLQELKKSKLYRNFFIIAVDAALSSFKALNLNADMTVVEESQSVIAQAFSGTYKNTNLIACGISSVTAVSRIAPEKTVFYTSLFAETNFLSDLKNKNLLPEIIPPLGSVGLSAVELALRIRKNSKVPVLVCGLDFSYSCGKTHGNSTFHDTKRRSISTKIKSFESFSAAWTPDSSSFTDLSGKKMYTTTALSMYGNLFNYKFHGIENLFKLSEEGFPLQIPVAALSQFTGNENHPVFFSSKKQADSTEIKSYLTEEIAALSLLKDIFTGKINLPENEKSSRITQLLSSREYLYLHFPDGYRLSLEQNFLNRVRIELDKFLSTLILTLNRL